MGFWPGRDEKQRVPVKGRDVAFVEMGKGDPVLLLHGFPTNSFLWRDVAPRVAEKHRVIVPDLPGFGHSLSLDGSEPMTVTALADRMDGLLAELKVPVCQVAGHGLGGAVAQALAARTDRVRRLALLDGIAFDEHWPGREMRLLRLPLVGEYVINFRAATSIAEGLRKGVVSKDRIAGEVRRGYVRVLAERSDGGRGMLRVARGLRHEEVLDATERLRVKKIPTLVVWGDEDAFLPVTIGERYAREMPSTRLVIVPQAGHFVMEDDFEAVADLLMEFFSGE